MVNGSAATKVTLSGGTIVDGSGRSAFPGNVVVEGGVITAVGGHESEGEVIDVNGCVVAPGFVDIHTHAEWLLGYDAGHALIAASLEQGITTVVGGNCGFSPAPVVGDVAEIDGQLLADVVGDMLPWSWHSFGDYLSWLEARGIPVNVAPLVGHAMLRCGVMRDPEGLASRREIEEMKRLLAKSLDEGAFGMSVGLEYFPGRHATPSEITALAVVSAEKGTLVASHTRGISGLYEEGMEEMLQVARASKCRLQVSHVNPMGKANWSKFERFQKMARAARSEGLDVGFDAVTYVAWTGDLVALLPHVVGAQGREAVVALANTQSGRSYLRAEVARHAPSSPAWSPGAVTRNLPLEIGWDNLRIADPASEKFAPYAGLSVAEAAEKEGSDVFDCYCDWVVGSSGRGRALIVGFSGDFADERPLEELLSDPSAIPGTDTAADRNAQDSLELTLPLFYGTMPRFIGHFRRDRCLFSLEEGVKRMTSMPAERVGLRDRGLLKVGNKADVTVFDPSTVDDQGDYFQPKRPRGIEYVLVNGQPVVKAGAADVERLAGQVLRSARRRGTR